MESFWHKACSAGADDRSGVAGGCGLLGKSFYRLLHVDTGMRAEHLATAMISLPRAQYTKDEQIGLLQKNLVERVEQLPGVVSAGVVSDLPVDPAME